MLAANGLTLMAENVSVEQNSGATSMDVLANDLFDPGYAGGRKFTCLSTRSLGGRLEVTGGGDSVRYTPPADVDGVETFRYTVDNRQSAEVSVVITSPLPDYHSALYLFHD